MTLEDKAAALDRKGVVDLLTRVEDLERQIDWFKKQLFGQKSEKRVIDADARQLSLGESVDAQDKHSEVQETLVAAHTRRRKRSSEGEDESDLRFDPSVPVEEHVLSAEGLEPGEGEEIGTRITHRLAQKPGSFVVLKIVRPVVKKKEGGIVCADLPPSVLGKSLADVSLLACMAVDKFSYHLPLYRQHQRMAAAGVRIARPSLTHWMHGAADLLAPIHQAQLDSVRESAVLAVDETPIKAGKRDRGGLKTGFFWPLYGDRSEISFCFSETRGRAFLDKILTGFEGVLLSDGYPVYERFAEASNEIKHAQCWSHARRYFVKAQDVEPKLAGEALDRIGQLYHEEEAIRRKHLSGEKKLLRRAERCKPIVEELMLWLKNSFGEQVLLPSSPFTTAVEYVLKRERTLKVFLRYPDVPIDTNHLEREIRPIALGRKNWLFCWTELGAHCVGIFQSLLRTCGLQGVDPYTYLVDVLQRVETHPMKDVALLTPRLWKQHFADAPMRSLIDR